MGICYYDYGYATHRICQPLHTSYNTAMPSNCCDVEKPHWQIDSGWEAAGTHVMRFVQGMLDMCSNEPQSMPDVHN
jgi:hypothetical protein